VLTYAATDEDDAEESTPTKKAATEDGIDNVRAADGVKEEDDLFG